VTDLKSVGCKTVWVQVPSSAQVNLRGSMFDDGFSIAGIGSGAWVVIKLLQYFGVI
jgi:hypothetical protein